MKYIKENKMKIVNFKDLDTWSVKNNLDTKPYKDVKFDGKFAQKVKDLFMSYEMGIGVTKAAYCKQQHILLPHEKNLTEYRVTVEKIYSEKEFINNWNYLDIDSFDDLDINDFKKDENYEDILSDYKMIGEFPKDEIFDDATDFSVFLPKNKLSEYDLELAAYEQASKYLKKLSQSVTGVYTNNISDYWDAFQDHTDEFKKFLELNSIKITNNNLEIIWDITHRLYRDAKFCYNLKTAMEDHDLSYDSFIQDWIKIL